MKNRFKRNRLDFVDTFLSTSYQKHNIARLSHLDSLGLPLSNKTVFEFGAGIGDHSYYYLIKNCHVTASDSRQELIDFVKRRFGIETLLLDVEKDLSKIDNLPFYDIIHCYGLFYHISNPEEFLFSLRGKSEMLLLETCVSHDKREDGIYLVDENRKNPSQAFSGVGCRPTRSWIFHRLKSIFPFVYMPITQPDHPEFPKEWGAAIEDRSTFIRAIFIASQNKIDNQLLREALVLNYQ